MSHPLDVRLSQVSNWRTSICRTLLILQNCNDLLRERLATGSYQSDEEVLLAGLKALDDLETTEREFREQFQRRRDSLWNGEGIIVEGDGALGKFFDDLDAEVDLEASESK
jgi:hypothetical protein